MKQNAIENKAQQLKQKLQKLNQEAQETLSQLEQELEQSNRKLSEENMRFQLVTDGVEVGIWDWIDIEKDTAYINPRYYELLGYQNNEFPASYGEIAKRTHPSDLPQLEEAVAQHFENYFPFRIEYRMQTKAGEYRWFLSTGKCERDTNGKPIRMAGSIIDIHEQKQQELYIQELNAKLSAANEELQSQNETLSALTEQLEHRVEEEVVKVYQSEQRWNTIIQQADDFIVLVNPEGVIEFTNNAFSELDPNSDVISHKVFEFLDKENAAHLQEKMSAGFQGEHSTFELEVQNLVSQELHIFSGKVTPLYLSESNQKPNKVMIIARDVTEVRSQAKEIEAFNRELKQKNESLLMQEEELVQANEELKATLDELSEKEIALKKTIENLETRNHELDNLVYRISHDLRSPIASILGLLNVIQLDETTTQEYLPLIRQKATRLDAFINNMLDFAKTTRSTPTREAIEFQQLIDECLEDFQYLDHASELSVLTEVTLPFPFYSDPLKMKILFSNLISNAIKYQNIYNTEQSCLLITAKYVQQDKRLLLTFEDNGLGISKEHLDRVFDMFYRATDRSGGSGLGLYIVKQTTEKLNGTIQVDSQPGKGTTFKMLLPVIK